jgi:hypothetical protein
MPCPALRWVMRGQMTLNAVWWSSLTLALTGSAHAAMDVRARNRIGDSGTAADTALWREECVPEEALFAGTLCAQRVPRHALTEEHVLALPQASEMQMGGKGSVGYGWVSFMPMAWPTALDADGKSPAGEPLRVVQEGTA